MSELGLPSDVQTLKLGDGGFKCRETAARKSKGYKAQEQQQCKESASMYRVQILCNNLLAER